MDGIKPNNKSSNVANLKRGMQLHRLTERVKKKDRRREVETSFLLFHESNPLLVRSVLTELNKTERIIH